MLFRSVYPPAVKKFMKQYIALLKMVAVHNIDGYVNPWNGNKLTEIYGGFFRGKGFYLPHGVDTGLYEFAPDAREGVKASGTNVKVDFKTTRESLAISTEEQQQRAVLISTIKAGLVGYVSSRGRVSVQGSVGRGTDLPGQYDVDIIALLKSGFDGTRDGTAALDAIKRSLETKGYRLDHTGSRPHNGSQWLLSGVVYNSTGRPLTKFEVTLEREKVIYPDLFNKQMSQIEERYSSSGREAVLADIRLMKHLLQNVVESYKWYHGGLSGIGAEQLVIQSGGTTNNGWQVQGLGSFAKAMQLIYDQGYDKQNRTIRSVEAVRTGFQVFNMDGSNILSNLNEWSWRRLVHAARVYVEGSTNGDAFDSPDQLRYSLEYAVGYRKNAVKGYELVVDRNTGQRLGSQSTYDFERVGEDRFYVFATSADQVRAFENGEFTSYIRKSVDAAMTGAPAKQEQYNTAVDKDIDGLVSLLENPNLGEAEKRDALDRALGVIDRVKGSTGDLFQADRAVWAFTSLADIGAGNEATESFRELLDRGYSGIDLVRALNGDFVVDEAVRATSGVGSLNQSFSSVVSAAVSGNSLADTGATRDSAQKGGIDFNPTRMDLNVMNGGRGIQYNFDPAMIQRLQNSTGFTPVIIDIQPMTTSVPMFLGLRDAADKLAAVR